MSVIYIALSFQCLHHLNCHYLVSYIWLRVFETLSGLGYSTTIACIQHIKFWAARQNSVALTLLQGSRRLDSQIARQSAHEDGKVVSPTHQPPLPSRKYAWYLFLIEAKSSPACSTVPQRTAPRRTPFLLIHTFINYQSLQPPHVVNSHFVACYWLCLEISFVLLVLLNLLAPELFF